MTEQYKQLVEKVRAINPEAAEYMETEAPKLDTFSGEADSLVWAFCWADTPHGVSFWDKLDDLVGSI